MELEKDHRGTNVSLEILLIFEGSCTHTSEIISNYERAGECNTMWHEIFVHEFCRFYNDSLPHKSLLHVQLT